MSSERSGSVVGAAKAGAAAAVEETTQNLQAPSIEQAVVEIGVATPQPRRLLRASTETRKSYVMNEAEFEALRIGSRSQLGDEDGTASTRSTPTSTRLASSREATRRMQQQERIDYLQAQDFPVENSSATTSESSSLRLASRLERIRQKLHDMSHPATASRATQQLPDLQETIPSLRSANSEVTVHTPRRYKLRSSLATRRAAEGTNWYSVPLGSRTLPHDFGHRKNLQASVSDAEMPSRSASLKGSKRSQLLGWTAPHEWEHTVASARVLGGNLGGDFTGNPLESVSPLERMGAAPLLSNPDEEDDIVPAPLTFAMTPLSGSTRRPPEDLTIDTAMSGGLPSREVFTSDSQRNSRFSEVLEEVDGGLRPTTPPKSPKRPSTMANVVGASNRNSAVWPVAEPATPPVPKLPAAVPIERPKKRSWWIDCFLAAVWGAAVAATIFGVSKTSPVIQTPACTLKEEEVCMPPSFSFVHNLRLNTTLPKVLQPFLPSLSRKDLDGLNLVDHGLTVENYSSGQGQDVLGGLVIRSAFSDRGIDVLSDIVYTGVIDGGGTGGGKRVLKKMMREARAGRSAEAGTVVSAQGASRNVTTSREGSRSAGDVFLAMWLAGLLAVEMTLGLYFAVLQLLWTALARLWRYCRPKKEGAAKETQEQRLPTAPILPLRWVVAGALGSAIASGILIAFWA